VLSPTTDPFAARPTSIGSKVIFQVHADVWTTDGTPEGTKRLDLRDSAGTTIRMAQGAFALGSVDSRRFLFEGHGPPVTDPMDFMNPMPALYVANVNTGRVQRVRDINRTPDCAPVGFNGIEYDFISNFAVRGSVAFFAASDKTTISDFGCPERMSNSELWITDVTAEGTLKVREIYPGVGGSIGKELG
jgi:ELWxxDGT repeat protein